MVIYKRGPVTLAEYYLDDPVRARRVSIARYLHRDAPPSAGNCRRSSTLVVGLGRGESELLGLMNGTTRYEIRRAEGEGVTVLSTRRPDAACRLSYADYYDSFAAARGLKRLNRDRFEKLAASGALILTEAKSREGDRWAVHVYILGQKHARLLHSASLSSIVPGAVDRNAVARAHRYLHWRDLLDLRDLGFERLDLGGWYEGTEDTTLIGINTFKRGFGGTPTFTYSWDVGVSLAGKLLLAGSAIHRTIRSGR